MQESLPQIFYTNYEDKNFIEQLKRVIRNFDANGNYLHPNKPDLSMLNNATALYLSFIEYFVFKHLLYNCDFEVLIKKTKNIDEIYSYMKTLLKTQKLDKLDDSIRSRACISSNALGKLGFVNIAAGYSVDTNKCISKCTIFIVIEMP